MVLSVVTREMGTRHLSGYDNVEVSTGLALADDHLRGVEADLLQGVDDARALSLAEARE